MAKAKAKAKAKASARTKATTKAKASPAKPKPTTAKAASPAAKAKARTKGKAKPGAKAPAKPAAKKAPRTSSSASTWKTKTSKVAKHKPTTPGGRTRSGDDTMRRVLTAAGWQLTTRGEANAVAEFAYQGHGIELKARGEGDRKHAIYLTLTEPSGNKLTLKIPMGDDAEAVLTLITSRQDQIDPSNYSELITEIATTVPGTQGVRDGALVDLEPR